MSSNQPKYLSEAYDESEFIRREIIPLFERLRELCNQRKLPVIAAVCGVCNPDGNGAEVGIAKIVNFHGIERTPSELVIAWEVLDSPAAALELMNKLIGRTTSKPTATAGSGVIGLPDNLPPEVKNALKAFSDALGGEVEMNVRVATPEEAAAVFSDGEPTSKPTIQ